LECLFSFLPPALSPRPAVKTSPIVPARLEVNAEGLPFSSAFGDVYHPRAGAFAQAEHVFLAGNGLPQRWQERAQAASGPLRPRFVVLETGFGLGNNFLATWAAWKRWRAGASGAQRLALELEFISIELHPFTAEDLGRAHAQSPCPELAQQLLGAWPPLTPNLHTLRFERDALTLRLALGPARLWLRELVAEADAFFLDGFAPARNPQLWESGVFKALARLAAPGATLATWSAARAVREGLSSAGFEVHKAAGQGGKRDITLARYAPRQARPGTLRGRMAPVAASAAPTIPAIGSGSGPKLRDLRDVWVLGAGLAGCSAAWALARHGLRVGVMDAEAQPAAGASGNPAGLFHSVVHGDDAPHARLHRAAALHAEALARRAIEIWGVPGQVSGLLRLAPHESLHALQALCQRSGLPPLHVRAVSPAEAADLSGWPVQAPALFFPGGGWLNPERLCSAFLEQVGAFAWHGGKRVSSLQRIEGTWRLLDAQGQVLGEAPTVVLAAAGEVQTLLQGLWAAPDAGEGRVLADWPGARLQPSRGQISWWEGAGEGILTTKPLSLHSLPRLPIAGQGYVIHHAEPSPARLVFGASNEPGVGHSALKAADQETNWHRLMALAQPCSQSEPPPPPPGLFSRAGVRWSPADRLPWVGAVPNFQAIQEARPGPTLGWEQVRRIPRLPGLYVHTGLGSRGLTWCALSSQLLAAQITGTAWPLEASLADALDPARGISRALRRG
jgi:tRNA 5-methylaminomethyl-2-thiouridine biosynthesis bifunctional protein